MLKELKKLIKAIPDNYDDFEKWIIHNAETYDGYTEYIIDYLKSHENATTSDIAAYEDAFLMKANQKN